MSNAPILYSNSDADAPTFPSPHYTNTDTGYLRYFNFYHILKTCLVDGYAGKPGAGWSIGFDHVVTYDLSNRFAYSLINADNSGTMVIMMHPGSANMIKVILCEAAPDFNTIINGWSGQNSWESGGEKTYNSHFLGLPNLGHDNSTHNWKLVANKNAAVLMVELTASGWPAGDLQTSSQAYSHSLYFGAHQGMPALGGIQAPEQGNFVVLGGYSGSEGSNSATAYLNFLHATSSTITYLADESGAPYSYQTHATGHIYPPYTTTMRDTVGVSILIPIQLTKPSANLQYGESTFLIPVFANLNAGINVAAIRKLRENGENPTDCTLGGVLNHGGKPYLVMAQNTSATLPWISLSLEDWY